jgi:cation diffusion facilitator family transporter
MALNNTGTILIKPKLDESSDSRDSDSDNADLQKGRIFDPSILNEGIIAGQKIAKISVVTLISIGIAELIMGHISGSVVATADGIDLISDAMISFIVFLGLRIAQRPADKKFHFGYHKVESFAALMAAIGMIAIGLFILYHSYESFIHPRVIQQPVPTMIVLACAGAISLHRAFQMRTIAHKYEILSLKTDAKNSIKDGSASVIGFFSVLVSSQFGFLQADAIGGMIIAGYIFSVSYLSLKRSSLILVDAWQDPKVTDLIKKLVEESFGHEQLIVKTVLLRPTGMVTQAEVHVQVDGNKPLKDVELLSVQIQMAIRSEIPNIERISVVPYSFTPKPEKKLRTFFGSRGRSQIQ